MDARLAKVEDALNGDQNDVPEGTVLHTTLHVHLRNFFPTSKTFLI